LPGVVEFTIKKQ